MGVGASQKARGWTRLEVNPTKFAHGLGVDALGRLPGPEQPGGWWTWKFRLAWISSELPISHPGWGEGIGKL